MKILRTKDLQWEWDTNKGYWNPDTGFIQHKCFRSLWEYAEVYSQLKEAKQVFYEPSTMFLVILIGIALVGVPVYAVWEANSIWQAIVLGMGIAMWLVCISGLFNEYIRLLWFKYRKLK